MDVIEAEIKCQAERHASGDARRVAMDAECASHTRGAPLDDTNTNNMNKHMQQGRRGTTNFILVARAERPGEARSRTVKRAPRTAEGQAQGRTSGGRCRDGAASVAERRSMCSGPTGAAVRKLAG